MWKPTMCRAFGVRETAMKIKTKAQILEMLKDLQRDFQSGYVAQDSVRAERKRAKHEANLEIIITHVGGNYAP